MVVTPSEKTISRHAAPDGEGLSGELIAILHQQISLAKNGQASQAADLSEQIDRLLQGADRRELGRIWAQGPIKKLFDELCLILVAARSEVADELRKVRTGKHSVRAYIGSSRR